VKLTGKKNAWAWLTRNVLLLGLVALFNDVGTEMAMPLLPAFMASIGAGALALGVVEGAADFSAAVLNFFSGKISDLSAKRKPFILGGYSLSSLLRPLFAISTQAWQVVLVRVADRTGKGLRTSARDAMIVDSVDERQRGAAFGFHQGLDHLGTVIGALLAVILLLWAHWGLRSIFWLTALPGIVVVGLIVFGVREPKSRSSKRPPQWPAFQSFVNFSSFLIPFAVFSLGASTDLFLLMKANLDGMPIYSLPLLWMALHAVKSFSSLPGGWLSDRWGARATMSLGWFYYALIYFLFSHATSHGEFVGLFIAYGLFYGLSESPQKALISGMARKEERGAAFGCYNLSAGILSLPASLIFGWLWESYGARAAFLSGSSFALLGLGLLWILRPRTL
jgi:MFS family permease